MQLSELRAVVTGGARGLGRAITAAFVREGARVLIFDIDEPAATATAAHFKGKGFDVDAVTGSVALSADVDRAFQRVDEHFGGIDILVNNAGISANYPTAEITDELWDHALAVNLRGPFLCARAAGRRMVEQQSGVILNIASIYGLVAAPERLPYCVSKSGVSMMARALAIEWGTNGVRVNALAPGYFQTALIDDLVARGRLDVEQLRRRTPVRRLADADEITNTAVFLCSSAASYITGQVIAVDGGWTAYGYT